MEQITEEIKKEIFRLIAIPGIDVGDIAKEINDNFNTNLNYEQIMQILSDEYLKNNLDYGRRLCCRF
ncbi:MAG: hypothetical protein ACFE8M_13355 [Candidatus Hermodarchaeota archaeon]